jgi:amidase
MEPSYRSLPAALPLHRWSAVDLAAAIRDRHLSSAEVTAAFLDRIDAVNGRLNAIVTLLPRDRILAMAEAADAAVARGDALGPLHGLPIALKDLMDVAGMRTTFGSPPDAERIAPTDCLLAEKLRIAGALIIGKTNTPEQGLGTLTFNPIFGVTRNPWDPTRHAGGSSGGAAAAVAAGMLPFADGSDSGGSIRYPAAFCGIVGLRPSPGRVPTARPGDGWSPHTVLGPMARSARDTALLLAGMMGRDDRSPIALDEESAPFLKLGASDLAGLRIAWSRTADGLPIDPEIRAVLNAARARFVALGCEVEDVEPDLSDADLCWEIIELHEFFAHCAGDVAAHREVLRAELVRNVELGRALTAEQIAWAQFARTALYRRTARLLTQYDLLALPAAPVPPPLADIDWVRTVDGVAMARYFEWQRCATRITVTAHPALSIPAGFSAGGLPVGLQLVGRHRDDRTLLRHAAALEAATGWTDRYPPDARIIGTAP